MTGTVVLVRHGETTWNRAGRIQGWADATLTEDGREQARAAGSHLADSHAVDRLVVSDLKRTLETADALRTAGVAAEPERARAWRERDFGELQGLTRTAIASRHPEYHRGGSLLAVRSVEGGESLSAFETRVRDGWDRLVGDLGASETVAVVTHGGPIRAVLSAVTGRELASLASEFSPSNCGLTEISVAGSGPEVVVQDGTDHLPL
ncbi:phosphoglycerate mutase [Halosimplex carlsbadense 2-9-1]|uniref:Phosphoglycerate mutase n=1 Tax=Halosimplex carlsbadense 2-9-1 TaxID=797114 RepID=M0D3B3_9EURY|nr:histidine phosphatase family protein [Halosimplex carlsbadense]ELZ29182.1 phosphoglycerate mutase [Halosimplex carlsbadense 2-9-1]